MNSYKSAIIDALNNVFLRVQNTKLGNLVSESLFFREIDNLIFILIALTLVSSVFTASSVIGLFAVLTSFLCFIKLLFKKEEKISLSILDIFIIIYLGFVIISLFGSSLFILSLKGFLKTLIYLCFYFGISRYFVTNKKKIIPLFLIFATLGIFESLTGIVQSHSQIGAISGWQDTTNLDVTEIISRSYGTLKPYNPNLLAGYLIAVISSLFYFSFYFFLKNNKKRMIISITALLTVSLAIIYTGCRGAYIALFLMYLVSGIGIYLYIKHYMGGLSSVKKRYKNLMAGIVGACAVFLLSTPAIYKRILSIFLMRGDSSTSFRMNVYNASWNMFLNNPILGIGVGNKNFQEIYGLYMMTGFDALACYSVPLEIAVESGIFALVAFMSLIVKGVLKCIEIIRSRDDVLNKTLVYSILLAITGLMTHGLVDTIFFRPQVQIIFWLNIGILNSFFFEEEIKER